MDSVEVPIEETVELDCNYPRVSERYFAEYYYIPNEKSKQEGGENGNSEKREENPSSDHSMKEDADVAAEKEVDTEEEKTEEESVSSSKDNSEHTCVLIHSNKLCLLTLSHLHPVLAEKKEISKVSYDVGKFNRLENQVSGKGKRGAQMIGPKSPVCIITCSDGSSYTVLAGVNGKLVEVNERLDSNPQLLSDSPKEEGYLAIVLPPLRNGKVLLNTLFSKEQYEARMKGHMEGLI